MTTDQNTEAMKHVGDVLATTGAAATFFGWLPNITALFALVYLLIRIYETKTIQSIVWKFKRKKR